jgi:hypothetical protein
MPKKSRSSNSSLRRRSRAQPASRNFRDAIYSSPSNIHRFSRVSYLSPIIVNPGAGLNVGGVGLNYNVSMYFSLDTTQLYIGASSFATSLPSSAEFKSLFDSFRIDGVTLKMVYSNNSSTSASNTTSLPTFYMCEDHDDANVPASNTELLQRSGLTIHQFGDTGKDGNEFLFHLKPRVAIAAYQPTAFSSYTTPSQAVWVNCGYPGTEHFGFKMWYEAVGSTNAAIGTLQIWAMYHFSFKGVI